MGLPRAGFLGLLMLVPLSFVAARRMLGLVKIEGEQHQKNHQEIQVQADPTSSLPSKIDEALMNKTSILLPPPMDLWRRNILIDKAYNISNRQLKDSCSCLNHTAKDNCCERFIRVTHKMGYTMTTKLFLHYPRLTVSSRLARESDRDLPPVNIDYRDVLLFRNIYDALKSGYLYHLTGRECWLNQNGKPWKNWDSPLRKKSARPLMWFRLVALKLPVSVHRHRSLCQFLQEEDEKLGMRVYIDFVFHGYFKGIFSHWALAQAFPEVRERTKHACYEDFLSPNKTKPAIDSSLSFLFNQTTEWEGNLPGKTEYVGPHATSHNTDPEQRRRLLQIIRELDAEVFNSEIAWVDSVLPC